MQIKDAMTQNCRWITPETTLTEAAQLMRTEDVGFLPVGRDDKLIGTITDRDIVLRGVAEGLNPDIETVESLLTPGVLYCFEDQTTDEVCQNLGEVQVRRLPVVNRDKRLVGVVSLGDLAQQNAGQTGQTLQAITGSEGQASQAA